MPVRRNLVDEAARRGRRQLSTVLNELRDGRGAAGLTQRSIGHAVGLSGKEIGSIERGELKDVGVIQLVRLGATVGLDVSVRTYPGGSPLRDAAQLRLLARFRAAIGEAWSWRTEVPVSEDPRDRRAFDAVLSRGTEQLAVEAVTRLTDAQAQVRNLLLKQEAAGLQCLVLVLANTRHNVRAVPQAATTLTPAFPLAPRAVLRRLRSGERPDQNGYVLV